MQAALAPEPTGEIPHGNLRAILARRGFRRLLGVRLLSQLGDGWFQAGLAGSVFFNPERAASPLAIAVAFAVLLLPYSTIGPFVGVFLDRWSRVRTLFGANAIRAALVVPAAFFVWRGDEGPLFVATALCIIALNRFFLAGISAGQPHVVDEPRLVTANSFATTFGTVVYSSGLASAAFVFHFTGTGFHAYAIIAGTAVVGYGLSAALTMLSFRADALGPDDAERSRESVLGAIVDTARGMVAGVRHLMHRPAAASVLVVQAVHRGLYGVLAITTLLLYRNYYNADDPAASVSGLLLVAAAAALGSLLSAVITPPITRRIGGSRWVIAMMASLAVLVPALALPFHAPLTVAAAFFVSLATQGTKIVTDTALQLEISDDYRGRVFSVNDTAFNLLFVCGLVVGALVLPETGRSHAVIAAVGVGYAALAMWYATVASRLAVPVRR